ncbi:MAG: 13E12 repeat family protein, partial [Actinomycetota bacterium]|nr:13E12 repeat family protein [Actinomycetota bacterium]
MDHTSAVAAVDRGALADAWQQLVEAAAGASTQRARISVIRALEDLKDAACAAQAELAVTVVAAEVASADAPSDQAERAERDGNSREVTSELGAASPASRARARRRATARRSAIAQIALARRESPHRAGVLVGAAEALVAEMPCTLAALRSGALNEYRTILLVRETACLDLESRTMVDRELCGDPKGLVGLGTKRLVAEAKTAAYRLDPASIVRRAERDAAERCVTLRPAPGAMTYLTALVPLAQGVAMLAQLRLAAQSARARGDERSQGQVMADTLVERVTGQAKADAVPVAVNLIMSDATLLASGQEAARLDGGHPMPAQLARELVANALDA